MCTHRRRNLINFGWGTGSACMFAMRIYIMLWIQNTLGRFQPLSSIGSAAYGIYNHPLSLLITSVHNPKHFPYNLHLSTYIHA